MHLLSVADLNAAQVKALLDLASRLKRKGLRPGRPPLRGRTLALVFEKPSTRTRVSFEAAMAQLGGTSIFLDSQQLQLSRGETVADTARVLSGYVSAVAARVAKHSTLEELATHSAVPVINALSDREHPCQALADLFTIRERLGCLEGAKVAWVGDGNNVCNSWLLASALAGIRLAVATPRELQPDPALVRRARSMGADVELTEDPKRAADGADVVYTDVWVSMGDEAAAERRRQSLAPYQVNARLVRAAKPGALVMHCLPAHRGDEITDDVMDGPQSVVFEQAGNRLHLQKALLLRLLGR